MRAVILAGGQGTRLRPYTTVIPKPLVPLGDQPVLQHILGALSKAGIHRIALCLGYLGELIELYLSHTALPAGMEIDCYWEDEPLGTAGALRLIPDLDQTFIVMNGDVFTNLDYRRLVEYHREHDDLLTVAMHAKRVHIELGVIRHLDGHVNGYIEKPKLDYNVSMGVYVYERQALGYLPEGVCQFPDLVCRLLEAGQPVGAYLNDADWFDVGTMDEYERASQAIERAPERFGMGVRAAPNPRPPRSNRPSKIRADSAVSA